MTRLQATSESTIMMVFLVMISGQALAKDGEPLFCAACFPYLQVLRALHIVSNHAAQAA